MQVDLRSGRARNLASVLEKGVVTLALRKFLSRGRVCVAFADGDSREFGDGCGPLVKVTAPSISTIIRIRLNPEWALPKTYEEGKWSVLSGDLVDLLDTLRLCEKSYKKSLYDNALSIAQRLRFWLSQRNDSTVSKRNVKAHYDLENEFYQSFLDPEMHYSCAFFQDARESLREAQKNKINTTIRRLRIDDSNLKVLDIGSGWGGLSREIATRYGASVTGLTLSESQYHWAISKQEQLPKNQAKLLKYHLEDYRLHQRTEKEVYDRIVSVGMFEHAGLKQYGVFFSNIFRLLKDDGIALIHTIIRPSPGMTSAWVDRCVFPGGYIAALSEILPYIECANLEVDDVHFHDGANYVKTLEYWRDAFRARWMTSEISREKFRRWDLYFSASQHVFKNEAGFRVVQLVLKKRIST